MMKYFSIDALSSSAYGCTLREGAAKALLAWPSLKSYDTNDWWEEDGIEADLSRPVLAARQFDLPLYFNNTVGYVNFYNMMRSQAYRTVSVPELGYSKRLRFISASQPSMVRDMILVSVRFSDDFPLRTDAYGDSSYEGYVYTAPSGSALLDDLWAIDGMNLSRYGVQVLQGSRSAGWQVPPVKANLTRDIQTLAGVMYAENGPGQTASAAAYDMTLRCRMISANSAAFMESWNALLYDLIRPGVRVLTGDIQGDSVSAVYKSSQVGDVNVNGGIFVKFDITLTVIGLASESGGDVDRSALITADGFNFITSDGLTFLSRG